MNHFRLVYTENVINFAILRNTEFCKKRLQKINALGLLDNTNTTVV